jgi:hypothetical protein
MRIFLKPIRDWWRTLPRLIRFLLVNCAIGIAGGWTFLGALIATDTASLRTLIWNEGSAVPIILLAAGFAITFGSAAMGAAVMAMRPGDDSDDGDGN